MPSPDQLGQINNLNRQLFESIPIRPGLDTFSSPVEEVPFNAACSSLRATIKATASLVKQMKQHSTFRTPGCDTRDLGEMVANVTLAYRHLEDGAMRLGKAIQAFDGGVSVYDK